MQLQQTQRHNVKLRLGISGASGFGKTYSSLKLAYGITRDWSKIAVIDTENASASLYSHLGNFNVLNLEAPFSPERYIEAIEICEKANMECLVLDSVSKEWNGSGGCLEIHEKLGGRFQDFAKITPRHQAFLDKILHCDAHVITTTRRKMDYSLDRDSNGRTKVVKHGMKEIQREGYEYELTVNFELINDKHLSIASKDRTGLFMNKPEFIIDSSVGEKLINWCNQGVSLSEVKHEILKADTVEALRAIYQKYDSVRSQIKPFIIERKAEIENTNQVIGENQIIQTKSNQNNGTNNSK